MIEFRIADTYMEFNIGGQTLLIETVTGIDGIERLSGIEVTDNASGKWESWMPESDWADIGEYPVNEIRYGEL